MKKGFIFGLLVLAGFSNAATAASSSFSTTGNWQTATGDVSGLLGQSAPATWTYETDLSGLSSRTFKPFSGSDTLVTSYDFHVPGYSLSGTAAPGILNGDGFYAYFIDDTTPSTDYSSGHNAINAMEDNGLDSTNSYDWIVFIKSKTLDITPSQQNTYQINGYMMFEDSFFSTPIVTLPPAKTLLDNVLLTYAELNTAIYVNGSQRSDGFASYAELGTGPSAVPVPAAAFMFAPALLGFLGLRRKAKNSAA